MQRTAAENTAAAYAMDKPRFVNGLGLLREKRVTARF